jgi:hypothetical protein
MAPSQPSLPSTGFVIVFIWPIVMPARPNQKNNQGHEANIKQE